MQLDSQRARHEGAAGLDASPGFRIALGHFAAQRLVGEGDAVLDVGSEVRRAGGGDDVDLERHPRAQLGRRARRDGGVHPLVQVDLVPGVQEDAEERITQPTRHDVVERGAGLPYVQRPVPLGHSGEVGGHQALHVVADLVRQLAGRLDREPGAALERAPDAERHGERVPALDRSVAGAEQAEGGACARGQHQVARERPPVPAQ